MHLIITDDNYLNTHETIIKRWWYERNKGWLFLSIFVALYSILQIIGFFRQSNSATDDKSGVNFFLLDVRFWFFFVFLALMIILWWFYRQNKPLKKIPFMREFEKQVRKTDMVYDLGETRLRITYGHAVMEYGWNMFQKFHFFKGYLIMTSDYYPINPVWIPLKMESKQELVDFVKVIQKKFKMDINK